MYTKIFAPIEGEEGRSSLGPCPDRENKVHPRKGTLSLAYECSKRRGQRRVLEGIRQLHSMRVDE
jgi:hypothetical protein